MTGLTQAMSHPMSPAGMRAAEAAVLASGGEAGAAMDEAGARLAGLVRDWFPKTAGTVFLALGSGHNAGDALVAARHLSRAGWTARHWFADPARPLADLTRARFEALGADTRAIDPENPEPLWPRPWVVLDGLVGLNARLPLDDSLARAVGSINSLRNRHQAFVVAVDLPSGLDGLSGQPGDPCVVADLTATLASVKSGLLEDAAVPVVGRLALLPLSTLPVAGGEASLALATSDFLSGLLPPRPHDLHKTRAGRVGILAGSPGMTGAAALAAHGALRAGSGVVTVFAPPGCAAEIAARCRPEIMVREWSVRPEPDTLADSFDALVIGPGAGRSLDASAARLFRHLAKPAVFDADALNALARESAAGMPSLPAAAPRLLTPHPGEFARLDPGSAGLPRREAARRFACTHPGSALLLKGPRTIVAQDGRPVAYNPTGHHGLATAGTGDVLAGIAGAMMARQPDAWTCGLLAAWLHGRASELACCHGHDTPESLAATALAEWLGPAFRSLRHHDP